MRILVLDDEEEWQILLQSVLAREGHDVDVAGSGADALERLKAAPPEALLMDLTLPDQRGEDFLRRLRELPGLAGLPVVVLSGFRAREFDLSRLPGARFVSKDEGVEAIVAAVRALARG